MRTPLLALLACAMLAITPASAQTIYTFTTAGAEGTTGPDQAMIDAAYASTNLAGQVTSTGGIQFWTVPTTGPYRIEGFGGQGYGNFGGRGAHISGEFNLTAGTTLKILVGQKGAPYLNFPATTYNHQFGGAGGSFITLTDNTPLVVAGGGGGNHAASFLPGADGQITENGAAGALGSIIGAGGTAGGGGLQASSADAGAGLLGNGDGLAGGQSFVNGGLGGIDEGTGGFGGGGGTSSWNNYRGGGGGGYSGGGGGNNGGSCCAAGGGGGSFNAGTNPVNLAGVQLDDGLVRITLLIPPPTFAKAFSPDTIVAGGISTLTFTIDNAASTMPANALDFTDNLPTGVLVATPASSSNSCGGTLTATAGSGVISLTGGSLVAGASCTIAANVTAAAAGAYVNVTGDLTSSAGSSGTATDTLAVTEPPLFSKGFATATAGVGDSVTLSFVIDNSANPVNATTLAFVDTLPAGMVVATPDNASSSCGGTVTATSGTGTISFSGGSATAGASCTVSADVTAVNPGSYDNVSGDLTSSLGNSGPASDSLAVTTAPTFSKSFASATVAAGAPVTLSFVINNTVNPLAATTLAFTDNLPAGMLVAPSANLSNSCGGTATAAPGSGSISLSGGSVPAGSSCTVSADVSAATTGSYVNTSGDLTSSLGNSGVASDTLTVASAPTFTKAFASATAAAGAPVTLSFVINNTANALAATTMAFTDNLPAGMLVAAAANISNSCGGTVTANPGSGSISLSGGSVAAGANCTVNADVSAATAGVYNNTSGDLTSSLGNSGTASDTITVTSAPLFAMSFAPTSTPAGSAVTLSFTIDNTANPVSATSLAFTDNLPAGLVVATPASSSNSCGGTLSATAGSGVISLTGGLVAASASCTVTVSVSAANPGSYNNVSGDLTSSLGNSGTASATLAVTVAPLFSKSFATAAVTAGDIVMLTFVIDNSVNPVSADGLTFTDNLPAGMVVATPANSNNGCGGTLTAVPGGASISLTGGSVAAMATCSINVDVQISPVLSTSTLTNDAGTLGSTLGSSTASATATLGVNSAVAVPALSSRGLLLLVLMLSLVSVVTIRRLAS
jgi:uncharacterized repeat protein (TIGR01451 family)